MPGPSSGLLRAGIALKLNQVKRATQSYLRDRTDQATGTVTSYAIAAGLFAAAGIFLIAALLVGAAALFRWVEINYGQFWAFGAIGGLLAVIAGICAAVAVIKLKRPPPQFPSLASRLRVAIKASPVKPDQIEAVRDTAAAILQAPAAPVGHRRRRSRPGHGNRNANIGLILMASLLGYAAVRRRQQARHAGI
ncbi:phage holin family protein [Bradyrhizobium sp. AUGA SZCCT0240]|uniref:phage holin family protein n=1 Tax=Bradyrhizobium sp. AUGA SZCCT0240 TaxID=2807669 RepID=UPI001BA5596B|nr:phage holin family protein [Bradyrhizobium sp. AUGA SZCCT0240]MBR1200262.1 phage holin family protein [Bradyrhizobium sp. AUGA SZCCT0158]MBR1244494.1 phage holin family protein [Bradyrhizobium sp. AUGA SZCCT0274]MBR1256685.1 phage holin family protein [Bradyrhizobium sp. AUGA SZCCT0240]